MQQLATDERVTLSLPRSVVRDLQRRIASFADRMHYLLERNTDGLLNDHELSELEAMSDIAVIGQMFAIQGNVDVDP